MTYNLRLDWTRATVSRGVLTVRLSPDPDSTWRSAFGAHTSDGSGDWKLLTGGENPAILRVQGVCEFFKEVIRDSLDRWVEDANVDATAVARQAEEERRRLQLELERQQAEDQALTDFFRTRPVASAA